VKDAEIMSPTNSSPVNDADAHLDLLLDERHSRPLFLSILDNLRDALQPPKLNPGEITSKPADPGSMLLSAGGTKTNSTVFTSLVVHVGVVALLLWLGASKYGQQAIKNVTGKDVTTLFSPVIPESLKPSGGGGGGGMKSPAPAAQGRSPRPAPRQLILPSTPRTVERPQLEIEPTIVADNIPPQPNLPNIGDPFSKIGGVGMGQGVGGGIGSGVGSGVGPGRGSGLGEGDGKGFGGGVYKIGNGVSKPTAIYKPDPEYSEEARKAKFQGEVLLSITVDEKGNTRDMRVVRSLGLGLDEKALEAVARWRFRPALKDGRAVPVRVQVAVTFRLL
jgi:TonB family protein